MLLLTTTGAKSGKRYTTPLVYLAEGDRMFIFASFAGAPTNPAWFHNLMANPRVSIEVGADSYEADAIALSGDERDRVFGPPRSSSCPALPITRPRPAVSSRWSSCARSAELLSSGPTWPRLCRSR